MKSALCHVHFKYLMLLEEMRSATVRPQPGAFLGCARMEMFWKEVQVRRSARRTAAFGKSVKFRRKMKFVLFISDNCDTETDAICGTISVSNLLW